MKKESEKKRAKFYRRGIVADYLPWLLISLALLALIIISIIVLKSNGIGMIDKIKDIIKIR